MSGTQEHEPLTIVVEAKDLSVGDWVVPHGLVTTVGDHGSIVATFENDCEIYERDAKVEVRMEDHGETE